jgi:hypothetical protein
VFIRRFRERNIKKLISHLKNENMLFFISIVWILVLFLSWDLKQILASGLSFSGTILGDYWAISSQATWLPLAAEVSRGNLFPIDPFSGQGDSAFRFFPYISLWLSGLLISIFGVGGSLFIGSSIIPTLSYIFMVLIYRCFLNWRWSISLSVLGILGFNAAPFREFLIGIFLGGDWINLGADSLPGAIGFPFPAISLLSFLMVFYFSIQRGYMSNQRSIILSIAWGLQSQIHIINLIFGIPFWFLFLALKIWRSTNHHWSYDESKRLAMNMIIVASICLPMVVSIWSQFNHGLGLDYLSGSEKGSNSFDWFFIIAYCFFPLLVLQIAYKVFRVDPYELLLKFLPVWVAMSVELFLSLAWQLFGIGLPSELLLSRLGLFFLHIFYFTPAIYCMHRSTGSYYVGSESLLLSSRIRSFFIWLFRDASLVYLPIFLIFLTVFFLVSSEKVYQKFQDIGFINNQKSELIDNLLLSEIKPGEVLIGPDNVTNLLLPLKGRYGGLWTNRIISNSNSVEVIERFATYAKVIGWTEKQFLSFMLPGTKSFNYSDVMFDISGNNVVPGFGYWLTFHNNSMHSVELEDLSLQLIRIYNSTNLNKKLKDYGVRRIVLDNKLFHNFDVPPKKVENYLIFDFY